MAANLSFQIYLSSLLSCKIILPFGFEHGDEVGIPDYLHFTGTYNKEMEVLLPRKIRCSNTGYRVISRANALLLPSSYRHAAHAMLHSPCSEDKKLFGAYSPRHAVLLQVRFDGTLGFPGGFIEEGESIENGLNRELFEELCPAAGAVDITEKDLVVSHLCPDKPVCIHFYCKKIEMGLLRSIERGIHDAPQYGLETLGIIRCPLYTMRDNRGGLPSFLGNNFIGNAREQLLTGLKHEGILSEEEINKAVTRYTVMQNEVHRSKELPLRVKCSV